MLQGTWRVERHSRSEHAVTGTSGPGVAIREVERPIFGRAGEEGRFGVEKSSCTRWLKVNFKEYISLGWET